MKNGTVALMALGVIFLAGCKKDDEAPVITINSPANHADVAVGSTLAIEIAFSDNEALSEYSIDIHNGAGHTHGKVSAEWDYETSGSLEGTAETISLSVDVPTDAELAEYDLVVDCLDKEGNEAQEVYEFHLE